MQLIPKGIDIRKDIDLLANKQSLGKFRGLLNDLGYSIRKTEFGIAGAKHLGTGDTFVDLHISVEKVHDISTNNDFPIDPSLFKKAKNQDVKGFYSKSTIIRAPSCRLGDNPDFEMDPHGKGQRRLARLADQLR